MSSSDSLCDVPPSASLLSTNAVSRGLSDLHTPTWLALLTLNVTLRTVLFHPLQLAIARKRVTREDTSPSVSALIAQAYRGEVGTNTKRKGFRGVYRGLGAAVLGNIIGEVSYLHTLELVKEMLDDPTTSSSSSSSSSESALGLSDRASPPLPRPHEVDGHHFDTNSYAVAVGGVAGELVSLVIVTPIAVVCNRQLTAGYGMASANAYRPAWHTGKEVWGLYQMPSVSAKASHARSYAFWRERWMRGLCGMRGLYAGLSAGLAELPASGVWWGLYSETKKALYTVTAPTLTRWEREGDVSPHRRLWQRNWFLSPTDNPILNATAGALASAVTAGLFNPVAVLHTRLQALPPEGRGGKKRDVPFARLRSMVSDLIRVEGWRGFFKGTGANIGAAVLDGVVFSLFFELTKLGSDRQFLENI